MALRLYNTLTRKKEIFKPLKKDFVKIYTCGPTVYWYQHIGNLRSYFFMDILKRVLKYNNYKIKSVMNITDVGHLTSDQDTGEDKIEKAALKEHKTTKQITDFYLKIFKQDLKKLNISEPDIWCKATENIKEQIELIKILEAKDYTYKTSDGIYFDTSKLKDYGKLSKKNIENLQAGKRISCGQKKNKTDFVLWKISKEPGKRQQEWNSPWGIGFPGWHIECSAMSSKYLGKQFDIHTGGEDHIPIHHNNEIAQSETAFGKKPWVKYWLHCAFLIFNNEKMSKSKGKILTLSDLEKKGYPPLIYRYFLLTGHYKKQLNFSIKNLDNAKNSYNNLKKIISEIKNDEKKNKEYLTAFQETIDNNLDTPKALQILWKLIKDENACGKIQTIKEIDKILGLDLLNSSSLLKQEKNKKLEKKLSKEDEEIARKRAIFRKNKNYAESDKLRKILKKKGYVIEDQKDKFFINGIEFKI